MPAHGNLPSRLRDSGTLCVMLQVVQDQTLQFLHIMEEDDRGFILQTPRKREHRIVQHHRPTAQCLHQSIMIFPRVALRDDDDLGRQQSLDVVGLRGVAARSISCTLRADHDAGVRQRCVAHGLKGARHMLPEPSEVARVVDFPEVGDVDGALNDRQRWTGMRCVAHH
eukprot:CAMPEP_0198131670 /NCGR_PEP_ID=MMETSP1442-20131203/56704_1 /TAXON_ID= /ORGANISM="Craspedostauros australis, Strain CCMP3328" /LENGTH=167 /DNA_ID=CAMNT_0043792525 /DNA_START=99 /DNA_END=599 /DNA_ORIENTATION=+